MNINIFIFPYRALASLLLVLGGCIGAATATAPPLLNSERIEARFGSYGVSVLGQSGDRRDTCLYSDDAGIRTCRTLAIVLFEPEGPDELSGPLQAIRAGASLGATLVSAGWSVTKVTRHIGSRFASAPGDARLARHFRIGLPATLALHIYDLRASRAGISYPVARLLELHHPDYLSITDLERIYGTRLDQSLTGDDIAEWKIRIAGIPRADDRFN